MLLRGLASILARGALGQLSSPRRKRVPGRFVSRWERWISEPRSAVLFVMVLVLVVGGGRKLLKSRRARAAIALLEHDDVDPEAIVKAAEHGRAGLMDLFRILGTAGTEQQRNAAGRALALLWARDEMIAEEEKALVRRGYQVDWKARRRYPRALQAPIPVVVTYRLPFLHREGPGVHARNLEWSHRITGARRANLEVFGPWVAGAGHARFELIPSDFETDGPHRLVFQTRVRTVGLTGTWEMELPHVPFHFEFDARLAVDALFALPDETRASAFSRLVRLESVHREASADDRVPTFLPLNEGLSIRDSPLLELKTPLPCDLAHAVDVEFEGVTGRFAAGEIVVSEATWKDRPGVALRFPIGPIDPLPGDAIDRPGPRRMRVRLVPDPDLGWADPDVRSIWPGTIETDWLQVEIVRR